MFCFLFVFLESILSKLQKIPGLYAHSCKSVFRYFRYIIFLFYLFICYILFDFYTCFLFAESIVLYTVFAYAVLQSWRVKMWRIFSQLSLVPAPTNHLHHHRCLTPRVQGPFPPHLALECLITTQVPLYTLCYFKEMALFLLLL